ncbi:RNA chaperone Hfq [Proteinivorax tanatarense]|uniref:RNA-binding protein Hfq n=1 Tax=Proteinivorax tanatarense TaxID=1260629 RepID=A0AAU7VQX3_9FIRM
MGKAHNLQDYFLNYVRRDSIKVTLLLTTGQQIKGLVKGFDPFTVVIEDGEKQQLVYKHAISTVIPEKEVNLIKN